MQDIIYYIRSHILSFPNRNIFCSCPLISRQGLYLKLDICPSLPLILRYIYCLVFQGASSITAEKHIDCPSIILPSTSKLLVGFDLFNCVNRASQRKALMHHLTLKVTTSKMTFNGTMRFNVSLGRLFQYTRLSVICVSCIKYQRQHFRIHNQMCN